MTKQDLVEQIRVFRGRMGVALPASRELSLAVTKLDEAAMWLERAPTDTPKRP